MLTRCMQLHTSRQLAVIIVHAYPWLPCMFAWQQQQAPVAEILESAESDSLEHSTDWDEVVY